MRRTFGICFLVLLSAFCLWKYAERLTPMERLHSGNFSLEQLQREKCVIITDIYLNHREALLISIQAHMTSQF